MIKASCLVAAIGLFAITGSQAATFVPEKGDPVGKRKLAALALPTVTVDGVRHVTVDDMLFRADAIPRVGLSARRWPDGRVIYDASDLTAEQLQRFQEGCAAWGRGTKVRCVPRTVETGGYVEIKASEGHGSSMIGYPGPDAVSHMTLLETPYKVAHELGHVLGMAHEHSRPDRADFVAIQWDNITAGGKSQFRWRMKMDVYGTYDFLSVMHYKQDNFSKNGQPTILILPPNEKYQTVIGTVSAPSELDIAGMNARYP